MALYQLDRGTINGIDYSAVVFVVTTSGNKIYIRIAGDQYSFIEADLSEFIDDAGLPFASVADFLTFWSENLVVPDQVTIEDVDARIAANSLRWKHYKALLTQSDTDAPVARVLNRDEPDYLGDIVWAREEEGIYSATTNGLFTVGLTKIVGGLLDKSNFYAAITTQGSANTVNAIYLTTAAFTGSKQDALLDDTYIEIAVRQRGSTPICLSAETSLSGNEIILTFDKELSNYHNITSSTFTMYEGDTLKEDLTLGSIVGNILTIDVETPITVGTVCVLSSSNMLLESLDYGLAADFGNFEVTNNVMDGLILTLNGDSIVSVDGKNILTVNGFVEL
jgi:hypothetical protein